MQRWTFLKAVASAPGLAPSITTGTSSDGEDVPWNIVVVVSDTLQTAYRRPHGNTTIQTPNLDRLVKESAVFKQAYPEALPTIPTRRTVHSGRQAFPFRNYTPIPWDNVYLAGWQPMSPDEGTVAEALDGAGYHCGIVSDVPH